MNLFIKLMTVKLNSYLDEWNYFDKILWDDNLYKIRSFFFCELDANMLYKPK